MRTTLSIVFTLLAMTARAQLQPVQLRCENLTDPLGVTAMPPRLSWKFVESAVRNQRQTAYRILVASSAESLSRDAGDLWDSGKVSSDQNHLVAYEGKALASHQPCFWKVQVWDQDDKLSQWSGTAHWSVGLLDPADWKAQWIGYDKPRQEVALPEAPLAGAKWIGFADDKPLSAPKGFRVYMSQFQVPANAKIAKAQAYVCGDDRYWFVVNGHNVATSVEGGSWKSTRAVDITQHVKPGVNLIRAQTENAADGPTGLLAKVVVTLADGKTVPVSTDESWRATDKPGENWHNREIAADAWPKVKVIGDYGMEPWGKVKLQALMLPPPPLLRTTFKTEKPVKRAIIYATALGIYDLCLNGQRVSDDRFNPGWIDYTKRVYYRTYDVTRQVQQGDNAIGAILSDGWFSGYIGWHHVRDHYGKKPRFAAEMRIEYADGTVGEVTTGPGWKASTGPTREADFLMGETCDARMEVAGWDTPAFDASKWDAVDVGCDEVKPLIQWHPGPAVKAFKQMSFANVTEPRPGMYVVDFAQNFAGVPWLKLENAQPGQKITLRFAERLNPDGTIYTTNLREARVIDTYIARGGASERWEPRFTFHGFQYLEITGLKSKPTSDMLGAVAISSDTPIVGQFSSSDSMLNQLHSNILWTQRANFIDIPTDCPQRDERLGWTGDAQVYVRTASLNADVQAFFTKWLVDLEDGQRADGQFPMVAPVKVAEADGGPAWADAGVICPWTIYEVYNDKRILEKHYPAMTKFIDFCEKRSTKDLLPPEKYHCFGDWLSIKADTPKDVIYMAYFARSAKLTGLAATVLGKTDDAKKYFDLFERIKAAFNKAYVGPDGRIKGNTQTCYVLAVAFDLLDEENRALAAKYLVEDIEAKGNHLSTGFIGTKDLMLALAKVGRNDVAYKLLHNETFPSWGFSIKHGATSIWERWDGWTPEKGFQDPGMNSFAHYSFGAVYQWMVENIGGIRTDGPGYRNITIAPQPGGKLTWAKVALETSNGKVESAWNVAGGRLRVDVTIPPNTTAKITLPGKPEDLTESGEPVTRGAIDRVDAGSVTVTRGSGTYRFAQR